MAVIDDSILAHFEDQGYVVVRGLLDVEYDIQPVIDEYSDLLEQLAEKLFAQKRLSTPYRDMPFGPRLMRIVPEASFDYGQYFDISLPQTGIREDTPIHTGPAVFDLLRSSRLLDAVEQFIGPEIYSNPVQHTRIKLPEHLLNEDTRTGLTGYIAWHQDLGVIVDEADQTEMLTVWFPFTKATLENGCLAVVPQSHKRDLSLHCRAANPAYKNQICIPEKLLDEHRVPLPMEPGDVLFMHRKTQHSGLANHSQGIRWSFDLRYQPIGQPTGRPWFPGFIARSRKDPTSALSDPETWAQSWRDARLQLAQHGEIVFNRWHADDPMCA